MNKFMMQQVGMKGLFWIAIFAFLMGPVAESRGATPVVVTIQSAVKTALDRNPDVRAARENLLQQEASRDLAYSQLLPVVNGVLTGSILKSASNSSNAAFSGEPYNQYSAALQLTQPLTFYPGGAVLAALDFAKKSVEIAKYSLQIAERDVTVAVIQSFYTVLLNKRLFEILKQDEKTQRQSLATTQRYHRIGRSELLDVLQADTQLALLAPQMAQAENAMKIAASQLATLLRETNVGELEVTGQLEPMVLKNLMERVKGPKKVIFEVLKNRVALAQFEDTRDITLAPNYPQLNLTANLTQNAYVKSELLDPYSNSWGVQLQLTIPLFSGLSSLQAKRQLAAQQAVLQAADDKLLDTSAFSMIQTQKNLDTTMKVLEASRLAAKLAEASMQEAERKYNLNTIDLLKFLTSEQSQLTAQSAFMQARYNFIQATTQYFVAGGLPLSELIQILGAGAGTE